MVLQLPRQGQAFRVVPARQWCGVLAQLLSGVLFNFVCNFVRVRLCHVDRFIVKMRNTKLTDFCT
jgi:hypothetical protein